MTDPDNIHDLVSGHYGRSDLAAHIVAALASAGADPGNLTVADLAQVDQLHAGFATATRFLVDRLELSPESRLLDVGSGIGGPARLAASTGALVSGVDLTPELVEAATELTERVGLAHRVTFRLADGQSLPFPDAEFEAAMMVHVGMNVPDKRAVFDEVRRVLVHGGRFGLYEQMRINDGPLPFPEPWADDARSSFVETPEDYVRCLEAAGFTVHTIEDRTPAVIGPPPGPSELGPAVVFGAEFAERLGNNLEATKSRVLAPVVILARATEGPTGS